MSPEEEASVIHRLRTACGHLDAVVHMVEAINLSQATFRKIKQNLFWAFFYNIAMIPLAVIGWMHPVLADGWYGRQPGRSNCAADSPCSVRIGWLLDILLNRIIQLIARIFHRNYWYSRITGLVDSTM